MINSIAKTINYARRNGIANTYYAVRERLENQKEPYSFIPASEEELARQRLFEEESRYSYALPSFSLLVPLYKTAPVYLRAMIDSCLAQTYSRFNLILADATPDNSLLEIIKAEYAGDDRIIYKHLDTNGGISVNTLEALKLAGGDYCCLLDHDDLLTPNALYEMAAVIAEATAREGKTRPSDCSLRLIYSDEDKCDGTGTVFYEPNIKPDFNLDYLLSNNYICHFTAIRRDLLLGNPPRMEYDGAQDYDMILRICLPAALHGKAHEIVHIPKVLYHWRCHDASTAANPSSKSYAYDAGLRSLTDNLKDAGIEALVTNLPHLGFYKVSYPEGIFRARADVGIVGGRLIDSKGRICGGYYNKDKSTQFLGLNAHYSGGFQHRAACRQDAYAVDLRCMRVRRELRPLLKEITGLDYHAPKKSGSERIIIPDQWDDAKIKDESIRFCKEAGVLGWRIVWTPDMTVRI
ncbi:glycosyltransferase [Butyrivibrio sp. MC2013]|uniref:glycosyltransferase n=1 Tax=Butyrivibrio sp. MC2013 TaxID=1280686 RepID=UPI0003F86272|nr:glycosyltransferase [Butyrivibrio sp. MC2013]